MTRAAVDDVIGSARPFGRIDDVASLQEHLQSAIELEHTTLPPYLCALYSLDRERNAAAAEALLSVFVEEMLHLALAANLLNAVGGRPRLDPPRSCRATRGPCRTATRRSRCRCCRSDRRRSAVRADRAAGGSGGAPQADRYDTIGQFYDAIAKGSAALRRARRSGRVQRRPGAAGDERSRTAAAGASSRWTTSPPPWPP